MVNYHNYGKSHFFNGKTQYKWPWSIAMLNYQRVNTQIKVLNWTCIVSKTEQQMTYTILCNATIYVLYIIQCIYNAIRYIYIYISQCYSIYIHMHHYYIYIL